MARKRTKLTYEKRRREHAKKQKRQEKLARKHGSGEGETDEFAIEGEEAVTPEAEEEEEHTTDAMFEDAINLARESPRRKRE